MDMEQRDYDSRTALHVAAAEGKRQFQVNKPALINNLYEVMHLAHT